MKRRLPFLAAAVLLAQLTAGAITGVASWLDGLTLALTALAGAGLSAL